MPRPMTDCDRWDLVTALFPFVEVAVRKPRPVLVLSNRAFNLAHGHLVGCMITTGAGGRWPSDHAIDDLGTTGLTHASLVRWKVFTLPAEVLGRRIGALAAGDRGAMEAGMATVFG